MRRAPLETEEMPPEGRVGQRFRLPERVAHYLRDVLRMQVGDRVELFDGSGRVVVAEVAAVANDQVAVDVQLDRYTERGESPCAVTLVQAIPKGKRWEMVLEKATELGVARVIPLETTRTVVHISDAKVDRKLDRWERVVNAAARQCERTITPEITEPMSLDEALETLADVPSFVAHTRGDSPSLEALLDEANLLDERPEAAAIWIGPEGGFDDDEVAALKEAGVDSFHMGPRILRAETAGLVAVTLMQAYLGDLS
ncbi:16S rRNA (uracil(1498)-N(3))-methyltransferase [Persicimonas caeni]|uniref:Ribosomal RNA small subunit methyltransferase E n=1 Tax=Persicimonas caeni TaxID=2292766 RepID=A0A4Y6Q147_PERCE|nr:16S rRNA (uracil(1498)-N(3))-methyltransferase [Persicimonas caeni]QDG54273.1 16S rRNA (uracil(1498)-N(3))-methyltransferase [Persicimonas caeni]QED35494.1 16S rRNA (uracil(1498)-N(3))-methyltransferase [Persicimonas caeni]